MLEKLSNFIVNKKHWVCLFMLLLTVASVFLMQSVEINEDMTKYLPDDSSMKVGIDIMADEFPEMEMSNTIRVMFDDLTEAQKMEVLSQLENIEFVESVTYDADSSDYNKENHTLYVLNTSYDYGSEEELVIESVLDSDFSDYHMIWNNDDTSLPDIPIWVMAMALLVLMVILFAMCGSWIEPILFLLVIVIAIVINMGTNLILGSVSSITFSIASILQLVLSMDYSIILMNRYRQEKEVEQDKNLAMKAALTNAFSSVTSSSLTTVVGLLMLVFMSFKIGMDLGIVLAKGVFISMVCVLTVLPGVILAFDKLICRTAKKTLHVPMDWAAGFSYKLRHGVGILLILLFIGAYWMQSQAGIAYTLAKEDEVADVFPASNTLVMVYENQDEDAIEELAARLEEDENVKSVSGYATTLGKSYTSSQLAEEIASMSEDVALNSSVIDMLYYDYYTGGETGVMTASEFLNFVSDTVPNDDTFSEYIDEDMLENMDMIQKFADSEELTRSMTAEELAEFFDMSADDIKDLFLFYYIKNDGVSTGSMTLATFADFVVNEVAADPNYGSMFDKDTLSQMEQLATFTDAKRMTTPYSYEGIASLLGMDADTVKLLFVYYYALSDNYTPGTMTLPEFVDFLQNDVMKDPTFSGYLDENTKAQIDMMAQYTDKVTVQAPRNVSNMAEMLGMDETMVKTIYILHNAQDVSDKTMTLAQFTGFLCNGLMNDPTFGSSFDEATKTKLQSMNSLVQLAASGQSLTPEQMGQILGMDEADAGNFSEEQNAQLATMNQMVQLAASGTGLNTETLAQIFGMEESMIRMIFRLYYGSDITGKNMTMEELVDFILVEPVMSSYLNSETIGKLQMMQKMIKATVNDTAFSHSQLADMLGMDASMTKMLYTFRESGTQADTWKISMHTVINFLVDNKNVIGSAMSSDDIAMLTTAQALINGSVNGTSYSASQLASLMGMSADQAKQLYLLYISRHGDTSNWKLSVKEFIDFIVSDVLTNEEFADQFDTETADMLTLANTLVDAVVSGDSYSAAEMSELLDGISEELDSNMLELIYLYAAGTKNADPSWTMTMETLFHYMTEDVLNDPRFEKLIDNEMRKSLLDAQVELEDGKAQLVSADYSRLIITSSYPEESEQTSAFITELNTYCADNMKGNYYLIGNSAMTYEMQQTFDRELLLITLLTAASIFLIVAMTFKSLMIPLILVLLVQCGVYITVSVTSLMGGNMYYLALLIVECILMGATIDYGILLTNYYREARASMEVKDALKAAYAGSTHTILTSGLILILVTAIVGNFFQEATIAAIVKTISIGALCATLLILFVLPGVLACCDRLIVKKKNS